MEGEVHEKPGSVVFDRYRLEEWIGAGGMGVVWRATDLLLDQPVALKRVSLASVDPTQAEWSGPARCGRPGPPRGFAAIGTW